MDLGTQDDERLLQVLTKVAQEVAELRAKVDVAAADCVKALSPRSDNLDPPPIRRRYPISTCWADVVTLMRVYQHNLRWDSAMAHRVIQARGHSRYLLLKICLKGVDLAAKGVMGLLGGDLVRNLPIVVDNKANYVVCLNPKAGEMSVAVREHHITPLVDSPQPSTDTGCDK